MEEKKLLIVHHVVMGHIPKVLLKNFM